MNNYEFHVTVLRSTVRLTWQAAAFCICPSVGNCSQHVIASRADCCSCTTCQPTCYVAWVVTPCSVVIGYQYAACIFMCLESDSDIVTFVREVPPAQRAWRSNFGLFHSSSNYIPATSHKHSFSIMLLSVSPPFAASQSELFTASIKYSQSQLSPVDAMEACMWSSTHSWHRQ